MALSKEQFDALMQVIRNRRADAYREQSRRQEEVESRLPAVRIYQEKIAALSLGIVEAGLGRGGDARAQADFAGHAAAGIAGSAAGRKTKGQKTSGAVNAGSAAGQKAAGQNATGAADIERLREQRDLLVEKKNELLAEHGYDEDYLDIHYYCEKCRDTGYVGNEKCGCFRQLESELLNREAGLPALLQRENFATFDQYIYDDIEPLAELLPDNSITQYEYMTGVVMRKVIDFVEDFETGERRSLLMMGPAGTGKTFLCNCIAKRIMEHQHAVIYERAGELFDLFSGVFFSKIDDERAKDRLERVERCELLILDDLGTEFTTDFSRSRLFAVISNRLSAGLSTIISTNLSLNQLSSVYGERLTSRFIGEYVLLPFYGSDLRVNKAGGTIR